MKIVPVENHASFFKRFEFKLTPAQMELLEFAYAFAKYGHRTQMRDGGERYFEHLRGSALILIDELGITDIDLVIAILLHDMLEDNFLLTHERIAAIFGERVAVLVSTMTKPKKNDPRFTSSAERHIFYFEKQLKPSSEENKLLKLVDRLHNMRTLGSCTLEKRERKIKETREVYFPLIEDVAKKYPDKAAYIKLQLEEALEKLHTN